MLRTSRCKLSCRFPADMFFVALLLLLANSPTSDSTALEGLVNVRLSPAEVLVQEDAVVDEALASEEKEASVGRFPYVCSLRKKDDPRHVCDGTLIDPVWVVTAAHCVDPALTDSTDPDSEVLCGIRDVHDPNPKLRFDGIKTVLHSDWASDVFKGSDIAMIQLDRPAQLVTPLVDVRGNLPGSKEQLSTLRWKDDRVNDSPSNKLYTATGLHRLNSRTCNALWSKVLPKKIVFCADARKHHQCLSDSGSPLLTLDAPGGIPGDGVPRLDILVGIASFRSTSCNDDKQPTVYTSVGLFAEWISDIINNTAVVGSPTITVAPSTPPIKIPGTTAEDAVQEMGQYDSEVVREILRQGLDPNSTYQGDSLLHWAARFDAVDSAKALIDFGADLEVKGGLYLKPLHYCGKFGSAAVAAVLLKRGAIIDDGGDWQALHYAASYGAVNVIKVLLDNGADIEAAAECRFTPLMAAAKGGSPEATQALLSRGADPGAFDCSTSVLQYAVGRGNANVIGELIRGGVNIDSQDVYGETALHAAAVEEDAGALRILVQNGANMEIKDSDGYTPLHFAVKLAFAASVELKGASPERC